MIKSTRKKNLRKKTILGTVDEADVTMREDSAKRRVNTRSGTRKGMKGGLKARAIPASDFEACADPLQVVVTSTPSAVRDNDSASPVLVNDTDLLGAVALQPCSFTTGGYGWKGKERLAVDLVDPTGGEKKEVQVMLTVHATVMGSKQVEKEVDVDPDTSAADSGAIAPAERVSYPGTHPTSAGPSLSSSDVSGRSSSSNKRSKPSENAVIVNQLVDVVRDFQQIVRTVSDMQGTASAPPPAPAPALGPLTEVQKNAVMRFASYCHNTKTAGDEWLSASEFGRVVDIFRMNVPVAELYLLLADSPDEVYMRSWVCLQALQRILP